MALRSKSTAYILSLLCEGEISGPAINDDWYQSTYLQETQVQDSSGNNNFDGVTIVGANGTATQFLNDFNGGDKVENETIVNVQQTYAGGATSRTITDSDVDHCRVTFSYPTGLIFAADSGKQYDVKIGFRVTVTADGESEVDAVNTSIQGRTFSEYRKQYTISNLTSYGPAPWVIKVYRTTEEGVDNPKGAYNDDMYWYSYTEIKEAKLQYRNRAVVGITLKAEDFGDNIPNRAFKIKGIKIKYPNIYNPTTRVYTGIWDGTFTTGYCNNPAWVMYDLLTNIRYGLGLRSWEVDKWQLLKIARYCDETVTYTEAQLQEDGTYSDVDVEQPRFTFNGVIAQKENALIVINHLASVFRGFPLWSNGLVSFLQDCPDYTTRIATPANVVNGLFEYEGTSKKQRHTACKVTWNNPDYFGKQDTVVIEDRDGIKKYGYNPLDVFAVGCTNRNEAILRAKYMLYTDINQTEVVKFKGGLEWADCYPSEIIAVQDPDYAGTIQSGRIVSSTTTSVTVDYPVTIPAGTNYVYFQQDTTSVTSIELTNSAASDVTVLTWTNVHPAPQAGNVWLLKSSNLAPRYFRVLSIREADKYEYDIVAYLYDPNKYSFVENNLFIEPQPPTTLLLGDLTAPSNFTGEPTSYRDGDSLNRKYGILLKWTPSDDSRSEYTEIQYRYLDGAWQALDNIQDSTYLHKDLLDGSYDYRIRAVGLTNTSPWVLAEDLESNSTVTLVSEPDSISVPTDLIVKGGGYVFTGKDCTVTWTVVDSGVHAGETITGGVVKKFKVEVYDTDTTTLRRIYYTASVAENEYTYLYEFNKEDMSGSPTRLLTFKIYSVGFNDELSTALTHAVSNLAPDLSAVMPTSTPRTGYIEIDWSNSADLDMDKYIVYSDTSNPPTTQVGVVVYPDHRFELFNVLYGTTYYIKIVPYDMFGVGVASQIDNDSPLLIPNINVDVELQDSVTITAEGLTDTSGDLDSLYDGVFDSGGYVFTGGTGEKYIQYAYNIETYFDRISIWGASNWAVYIAYSTDGSSWTYLKGEADHTLDADGVLVVASDQADASTNYWATGGAGLKVGLFPNNVSAKYIRIYCRNTGSETAYEIVPARLIISELAAIGSLSAISANIGTITAGVIQSEDYPTTGLKIDIDTGDIIGVVTFTSNTSGYSNITDKPTTLDDINGTEYDDLTEVTVINNEQLVSNLVTDPNCSKTTSTSDDMYWSGVGEGKVGWSSNGGMFSSPCIYIQPGGVATVSYSRVNGTSYRWFPCKYGDVFYVSYWYACSPTFTLSSGYVRAEVVSADKDKANADAHQHTAFTPVASVWTHVEGTITITDAEAQYCYVRVFAGASAAGEVYFDDIYIGTHKPGADITSENTSNNTSNVGTLPVATVQGWAHSSDTTKIDGGDVYAGSSISIGTGAGAGYLRIGATNYSTGDGIWQGDDGGTYKFRVGNPSGQKVQWDGSALSVNGTITIAGGSGYANISDRPAAADTYNSYNVNAGNMCFYSNFEGKSSGTTILGGWAIASTHGSVTYTSNTPTLFVPGTTTLNINEGVPYGGVEDDHYCYVNINVPVVVGKRYCGSVYTGAHRCKVQLQLQFFDSSDNYLGGGNDINDAGSAGGTVLTGYDRLNVFYTAPANSQYVKMLVLKYQTKTGETSSYMFACMPMLSEVGADQTTIPPWSRGGLETITATNIDTTVIDGGKIITGLLTASNIQTGTLDASVATITNISASNISTGTLSVDRIAATSITAGKIVVGDLTYTQLAGGAVSTYGTGSGSTSATASVTKIGSDKILILARGVGQAGTWAGGEGTSYCAPGLITLQVRRTNGSGTLLAESSVAAYCEAGEVNITYIDEPGSTGSQTYWAAITAGTDISVKIQVVNLRR